MAFPSVRSDVANVVGANSNLWTLDWPATISAGDLLLAVLSTDGAPTVTGNSGGFSVLSEPNEGTVRGHVLVKVATGSETGTFTVNLSASEQGGWRVASYQNWFGTISGGVEVGGIATGASNAPDAGSFDPSWGTEDTRWRAQCACDDGRTDVTSFPTGWTINPNSDASGGSGGASIGGASIDSAVASVNPSAFGADRSDGWVAWVIAIRPAAAGATQTVTPATIAPTAIFAPTVTASGGGATQFARPSSDVSTGSWTATPLWDKVDDVVGSGDADEIASINTTTDVCELGLTALSAPAAGTVTMRWRSRKGSTGGMVIEETFELREGASVRATYGPTALPDSDVFATRSYELTTGERDAITDWANLSVRITRTHTGTSNRNLRVADFELEAPAVAGGEQQVVDPMGMSGFFGT